MSDHPYETHVYTGPNTAWGLKTNDLGRRVGGRRTADGGVSFERKDGIVFIVGKDQVEKNES